MTLVPFDFNLINKSILSKEEIKYINSYNKRILESIKPILEQYNDIEAIK